MKNISNLWMLCIASIILTSCAAMLPDVLKTVEEIENDGAVTIQINKEAIQKKTNVKIYCDVINTDS